MHGKDCRNGGLFFLLLFVIFFTNRSMCNKINPIKNNGRKEHMFGKKKQPAPVQQVQPVQQAARPMPDRDPLEEDDAARRRRKKQEQGLIDYHRNKHWVPGVTPVVALEDSFTGEPVPEHADSVMQARWDKIKAEGLEQAKVQHTEPVYTLDDMNQVLREHPSLADDVAALMYTVRLCFLYGITIPGKFLLDHSGMTPDNNNWSRVDWSKRYSWEQAFIFFDRFYGPESIYILWKHTGSPARAINLWEDKPWVDCPIAIGYCMEKYNSFTSISYQPEENQNKQPSKFITESDCAATVIEGIPRFYAFRKEFYEWLDGRLNGK
jgi:hypothetical protein